MKQKPKKAATLLHSRRFVMALSLFLAIVVWVMFAVVQGEEHESTIAVPLQALDLDGTIAQELGLEAFWTGEANNPNYLTVDVSYRSLRHINVRPEDIQAVLVATEVFGAGHVSLEIRVSHADAQDRDRFEILPDFHITGTTQRTLPLFFDRPSENTFDLEPEVIDEFVVPEGYFAADLLLLQPRVRISGPQTHVREIDRVVVRLRAPDYTLYEERLFESEELELIALDVNGRAVPYLTIENSEEIRVMVPVWQREMLTSAVEFLHLPSAFQGNGNGLRYTISPQLLQAALPTEAIPATGGYIIGSILARELSPENNRFSFPAQDLVEIHFFEGEFTFEVEVDMRDFATTMLTLPATRVVLPENSSVTGQFGRITSVTVVGPADIIEELTPEDLTAVVVIAEDTQLGTSQRLSVEISVNRDDSWVFGEYTVLATLQGED